MVRIRVAFVLLVFLSSVLVTAGFDLSFWDDDNDSSDAADLSDVSDSSDSADTVAPSTTTSTTSGSSPLNAKALTNYKMATPVTAISTVTSTYRNWVGPWSISPDTACYREAHIMDTCPSNYDRSDATNTCWTECPLGYPVECGMECIRQNDDCKLEVFAKVSVLAVTALDAATGGVFAKLAKVGKHVTQALRCANSMMTVIRGINRYVRNIKTSDPQTSQAQIMAMIYQTNLVVTDMPIAIIRCLFWKTVPPQFWKAKAVLATSQYILMQILAHDDDIISSWSKFKAFLEGANFTEAAAQLSPSEISSLESGMKSNSTCGADLKSLTDRTWAIVDQYREENADIAEGEIRLKISNSDLMLYDIATVTNNCMELMIRQSDEATAYKTRETLRKTFGVIISDLITKGSSNNGTTMKAKYYAYQVIDKSLAIISTSGFDDYDISTLLAEYVQTICGPTQFMGEIDDGDEAATLGLNAIDAAFKDSNSSWTRVGDGQVVINFTSNDKKDVTVNIMSGGDKISEIDVKAGGTATWISNTTAMGGKTLYLDRWRPGFLGLPGTGGGSLVLWVPRASKGGHLELNAKLNVS